VLYYWPLGGAFVLAFVLAGASLSRGLTLSLPQPHKAKIHAG
jgi:hypothetical protein